MFKKVALIFTAIVLMLSMTACKSTSIKKESSIPYSDKSAQIVGESNEMSAEDGGAQSDVSTTSISANQINRKVIFNANFEVQTKDYDKTISDLNAQIKQTKSYIQSSNTYGDKKQGDASSTLVIRVPSAEYEKFKLDMQKLGNVISSSEGGEDVTGDYFDKDARLNVLKAQEKRVLELLQKAEIIEDILKIEAELTRIRAEIEQLTTVIKRYDDLISYSTITVSIYQTADYVIKDDGFFSKIVKTMKDSLQSGLTLIQNIIFLIVWLLPYLIVSTIIGLIVRKILKKKKIKLFKKTPPSQE
ncbi:MAG: DUF4349 domain-containing protein [Oscillospiraceae bacterium]